MYHKNKENIRINKNGSGKMSVQPEVSDRTNRKTYTTKVSKMSGKKFIFADMNSPIIKIYPSILKSLLVLGGCILLTLGGWFMRNDVRPDRVFIAYAGIIFFGLGIVVSIFSTMLRPLRLPWAIIHEDRLEVLVLFKFRYQTFRFDDIEQFYIIGNQIYAIYPQIESDKPTGLLSNILNGLPELCNTLNRRLEQYRNRP